MRYRKFLRNGRKVYFNLVKGNSTNLLEQSRRKGKVQREFNEEIPFFCDINGAGRRSQNVPESVHKLTPGDIDVIGAIGDSLTAGVGALATTIPQLFLEFKGVSWATGGQSSWRQFLTLPNILKEFNPNLYGYSVGNGYSHEKLSKFNIGEFGGMSRDLPHMSQILIQRMKNDPKVNLNEHWKMINIHIGGNDFCIDICYHKDPYETAKLHEKHLLETLRTIRDALPRTMVNLIMPPDVFLITRTSGLPIECKLSHVTECPCLFGFYEVYVDRNFQIFKGVLQEWRNVQERISALEEFNSDDFTVNLHKFTTELNLPQNENGASDLSYMSSDCFHLSQKGNAAVATTLWNSLMDGHDEKKLTWNKEFEDFRCPSVEHPYLRTRSN
ncbi:phospholipase B1, membrane-associated-like [Culicoides brevitarsis]|uniref:phospholipase B1, membrane-associated-like n=1 Tax=Culicoides brevitarsis TaxID=469753 RepID=UPI00307B38F5